MAYSSFVTCAQVFSAPSILLFAMNSPSLFYRSFPTRVLTVVATASAAGHAITTLRIASPSLAFMTGLLECWTVIWAAVLLLHHKPITDARRRRWSKRPERDGEYDEGGIVWQRYPRHNWVARLAWSFDLLISFRGVGWEFGTSGLCFISHSSIYRPFST